MFRITVPTGALTVKAAVLLTESYPSSPVVARIPNVWVGTFVALNAV